MHYLTIEDVAEMLRISVRTVRSYVADGTLPGPFRLKRKPLWQAEDIDRAVADTRSSGVRQAKDPAGKRRGRPRKLA